MDNLKKQLNPLTTLFFQNSKKIVTMTNTQKVKDLKSPQTQSTAAEFSNSMPGGEDVESINTENNGNGTYDLQTVEPLEQLTTAQAFQMLKNAKPGELASLNANYWKPTPGEISVFMFTEMTTFKNERGETMPAVSLTDETGRKWINASAMLTGALEKVTQLPAYVRITYKGKKENAKRQQYDDFIIETFHAQTK